MKYSHKVVLDFGSIYKINTSEVDEIEHIIGTDTYHDLYRVLREANISIIKTADSVDYLIVNKFVLLLRLFEELNTAEQPPDIYIKHNDNTSKVFDSGKAVNKVINFTFINEPVDEIKSYYKCLVLNGTIVSMYKYGASTDYRVLHDGEYPLVSSDHELKPNVYEVLSATIDGMKAITGVIRIDNDSNIYFDEQHTKLVNTINVTQGFNMYNLAKGIISINSSCVKAQDILTQSINNHKVSEIVDTKAKIESVILKAINLPDNIKINSKMHVGYDGKVYTIQCEFDGYILIRNLPNVMELSNEDCLAIANQYTIKAIQLFLPSKEK